MRLLMLQKRMGPGAL